MDEKAKFRHVWQESEAPVFNTYLWHDENAKIIQAFGQQAKVVNGLGMLAPLQYFLCFQRKNRRSHCGLFSNKNVREFTLTSKINLCNGLAFNYSFKDSRNVQPL